MAKKKAENYQQRSLFTPISKLIFKNIRVSLLLFSALIIFGLASYTTLLRREGFPSVAVPISVGGGQYFVDDASQVDEEVSRPIAALISEIEGVKDVTTTSDDNTFQFFADLDSSLTNVEANNRIEEAIRGSSILPEAADFQMVEIDAAKLLGEYDVLLSVYSRQDATLTDLTTEAEALADRFLDLELVGAVTVVDQFTVNPADDSERFKSSFARAYDPGSMQFRQAITVGVTGQAGDNFDLFELDDQLTGVLEDYNQASDSYFAATTADLTTSVEQDIASLQGNVITGAIVVTIISALLISWRVSVLTAFFIIAVLLVSVAVLYLTGFTLNTITLFSLVLALGLFVDDATIIAEAIYAKRGKNKKAVQVVTDAINSIGSASFSGTLTTALVFTPLLFISGILGDFIFQMPMTVIISLLVSFFLSITLIPLMANYSLLRSKEKSTNRTAFLSEPLARSIQLIKRSKAKGLALGVSMFALSIGLLMAGFSFFGLLGNDIFPNGKDGNALAVTINYDTGTTLEQAEVIADDVTAGIVDVLGDNMLRSMIGTDIEASDEFASVFVELVPYGDRDYTAVAMAEDIEERFASYDGAEIAGTANAGGPPELEFPLLAQVSVKDSLEESQRLADDILVFLQGYVHTEPDGTEVRVEKSEVGFNEQIVRLNGTRYIEVRAGFDEEASTGIVDSFIEAVDSEFLQVSGSRSTAPVVDYGLTVDDVAFDLGQDSDFAESFNFLPFAALGALVAMYTLLAVQFRSLLKPVLILLALPFSFFGIGLGLYVTDNPLSFFVMIGIIGLIGIAVNNTILLVDNAVHHRKDGMDSVDAIAQAVRERFRPLVTTTLTTVAALLPLALTNPFWEALSFTIIFGLVSSTVMVLLAFPYYYLAADYLSDRISRSRALIAIAVVVGLLVVLLK